MNPLLRRYAPAVIGATAATGLAFYAYNRDDTHVIIGGCGRASKIKPVSLDGFEVNLSWGPPGLNGFKTTQHLLLSKEEQENKLKAGQSSTVLNRKDNMVVRWDVGVLGSNNPCEDRHAIDIIPRDRLLDLRGDRDDRSFWQRWGGVKKAINREKGQGDVPTRVECGNGEDDLLMFSVLDGHGKYGGYQVAELMRKVLHPTIAYALAGQSTGVLGNMQGLAGGLIGSAAGWHPSQITKTMYDVILELENDLLRTPFTLIRNHLGDPGRSPLLPHPAPSLVHLASLENSGTCVTNVTIDLATDKLYVANVGDCRAVAGWWDPVLKTWRCDVMSEIGDMNGDNHEEAEMLRNRHPDSERDDVVCDLGDTSRVLGNSQITRDIGNATNKRQIKDKNEMREAVDVDYFPNIKPYLTPPYVLGEPEIVWRELHPATGEQLKFIILATDGLWDQLSSEEATLLLSAHLSHPHNPDIAKTILPQQFPYVPPVGKRPYPIEDLPGTVPENSAGSWVFEDDNAATHLIRNCLGRGDRWAMGKMISMTDGLLRAMRDDITAIVVMVDEEVPPPTSALDGNLAVLAES